MEYRVATTDDVIAMEEARLPDTAAGPADPRMRQYLAGTHHPQMALGPRVIFIARTRDQTVGYIGGHLTRRYDCDGELQYLYVVPDHRRGGVASELFERLREWFRTRAAARVCVDVEPGNAGARAFYRSRGATDLNPHFLVWEDIGRTANG